MAAKEFIVAIELGSSKITAIAGKKDLDGTIRVMDMVKADSTSFIRRGVVYNIDKTAICLGDLVFRLAKKLKTEIVQAYVGVGGQSLHSVRNVISKDLAPETKITDGMVVDIMDSNREMRYNGQEVIDVINQEYKVDNQYLTDVVGIQCTHLEGQFLNILQRRTFNQNLNKCFEMAGITIAETFTSPIALAESILTDVERRSGCALVDIGASTTTVMVYSKNMLRHLAVIPLGSANITKDIATLRMDEEEAERMKLKYGSAITNIEDINAEDKYSIDNERSVETTKFVETVEARVEEIIRNVWKQIDHDYSDGLNGGIILTGGGSNMKNIAEAFRYHTHVERVRVAGTVDHVVVGNVADLHQKDGTLTTVLSLLAKGDSNCAGSPFNPDDVFEGGKRPTPKKQAGPSEEELRRKAAEEERKRREAEEEARRQQEAEEAERRENTPLKKIWGSIKKFSAKITEEEKED